MTSESDERTGGEDSKAKKGLRRTKSAEVRIQDADSYGDRSGMSDADAHRDSVYENPGMLRQVGAVYMTQMKRFTKEKTLWLLLALLVALPVGECILATKTNFNSVIANAQMSTLLILVPVISAFIAAKTCGSMMSQEFNERTAYMSLPLPMSRMTFYLGKFLSGFSICAAVILAAYGLAMASSTAYCDAVYAGPIMLSMAVALATMFFYCAISYMFSIKAKRGAVIKTLVVLLGVLPAIAMLVYGIGYKFEVDALMAVAGYFPCFGPEMSLYLLGTPFFPIPSAAGLLSTMNINVVGMNPLIMSAVCVVCGVVCFALGYIFIKRRDL